MPLISVIIPTYNRAHTIKVAIDSVLAQTYKNWEIIVSDDGSVDNTKEVVESYNDNRIKYFKKKNGGPSSALNFGISHASGKWIMYLDSDDEIMPACMSTMIEWVSKDPKIVFAFPRSTRTLELYEDGKLTKTADDSEDTPINLSIKDVFNRNGGFSRNGFMHLRSLFDEGIKWDEDLALMEDWELMLSIGEKYPDGFLYVPIVLQLYTQRFGGDSLVTKAQYGQWADAFEYIYNKHKNDKSMTNQTWYPSKVEKWRKRQTEYEVGKRPPYTHHHFI